MINSTAKWVRDTRLQTIGFGGWWQMGGIWMTTWIAARVTKVGKTEGGGGKYGKVINSALIVQPGCPWKIRLRGVLSNYKCRLGMQKRDLNLKYR